MKDTAAAIKAVAATTPLGGNLKAAHLGNLAINALKYLILNAESDDLRYQAAQSLLQLPAVQRKLEVSASVVKPAPIDRMLERRIRKVVESGSTQASEVLRLIEEAEREAGMPAKSGVNGANPMEEKPNP